MSSLADGAAGDFAAVVPAYGDSPFLPQTLASLATQDSPVQLVVATSTPSDFIAKAAAQAGATLVVNPERSGIARDWNFALGLTNARFVTLAHQDDYYDPAFVRCTRAAFARTSGAALCFTAYQEIDDDGAPKSSKISRVKHLIELLTLGGARRISGLRLRAFLAFGNPLPCSSVTFDRQSIPDFRFSDAFASNLDWDAWLRLCDQRMVFARAPQRLVGRRHNPLTATSGLIRDGRRQAEDLIMFRRLWPRPFADAIALVYRAGYR
jgi:glycosyltransferase involved in cell wall biosynthesis